MKRFFFTALILSSLTAMSFGQGRFLFSNRESGLFDVPFISEDTGLGGGASGDVRPQIWTADRTTLLAEATWRSDSGVSAAYVTPLEVVLPGNNGTPVDLALRFLINGNTYGAYDAYTFTVTPTLPPEDPAFIAGYSEGLNGGVDSPIFFGIIPEPTVSTLWIAGIGLFLAANRWRRVGFRLLAKPRVHSEQAQLASQLS